MNVIDTNIPAVKIIEPRVFEDKRGFFMETWNQQKFEDLVTHQTTAFVQDNHSKSSQGILRGLHLQKEHTQGKLVRVVSGEVFDVAVDLRKDSPTYGQWVGEYLSADNKRQLWVPEGFGHGFYVVSEHAEFVYKCTDYYHPQSEVTIAWDDKELAIKWPLKGQPLLSEKDKEGISLREFQY
ncbi:dTDP-4-dehydrorhamnose 3,5-epimerase [Pseudoalteromonas piscicida]|uniref:dTDP-4-dehydrorhamnose 3,5-epimerase n=1 Tax=Pseudoalteromonas piscicida TaxID=43662 RepID=UPI001C98DF75|nr:dTDP-4-dehydrorhamnose 3,5-epimerase [Pseudoalteromonas piscicida]QZO13459.1 dTDP-4-dehydrorhamnose 3,5-epimerase [Pseudoalteromonas piscicida]